MNEVIRILESGRGKIIGKVMLFPVNDKALFQVKVLGLSVEGRNGVQVRVRPIDGAGAIVVPPCDLVDNTAASRATYDRRMQAEKYFEAMPSNSTRMMQTATDRLISGLTNKQRSAFEKIAPKTSTGVIISWKSASGYELKRIAKAAVACKYNVNDDELDV